MSQSTPSPNCIGTPRSCVYSLSAQFEEATTEFHVAVFRDDLHCFVVLATIPAPFAIGLQYAGMLELGLAETLKTGIVNWDIERITLSVTSWLVHRDDSRWRAIRRIRPTDDGRVKKLDWLPSEVAEPILRALEDSVPPPYSPGEL